MIPPNATRASLHPAPDLAVERIGSMDGLLAIEEAWREVEAADQDSTVFSTWEWTEAVALNLLPPEADLWTLAVSQNGEPAGIAPLLRRRRDGLNALTFLGAGIGGVSLAPYQDILAVEGSAPMTVDAVCSYLDDHRAEWDMLWLQELPDESQCLRLVREAADRRGWKAIEGRASSVDLLDLPDTWSEYRLRLGPVVRSALDMGLTGPRLRRLDTRPELKSALAALHEWSGPAHQKPASLHGFESDLADGLFQAGMLDAATLEAEGMSAGVRLAFAHKGRHYLWSSSVRPGVASSVDCKHIMDAQALNAAIDAGFEYEDFLRENGVAARRYGATRRRNRQLRVFHSNAAYWRYRLTSALRP